MLCFFLFKLSHYFTFGEQLDRFDVDVMEKPFFMLSGISNVIRNHLHLKVPIEVGVFDVPICIKDALKYLVLKSLNDVSVALSRASPQLYAVGPQRLQYLHSISLLCMARADLLPMSQYIFLYFSPISSRFFLDMATW